jgi:hypothetical protein
LSLAVNGPLVVDDLDLVIRAALDGVGRAYMSEEHGAEHLASVRSWRSLKILASHILAFSCTILAAGTSQPFGAALINTHRIKE